MADNARAAKLLRIHLSEGDSYRGKPLHEAILDACQENGIAGATVFRGLEGYGESAEVHRRRGLNSDRPILVVVVDEGEKLARLIPMVEAMAASGMMAISDVTAIRVRKGSSAAQP